jgi:predicted TIM-barrel enzyme
MAASAPLPDGTGLRDMAVRFVEALADCNGDEARDDVIVLCPWLKGLPAETGPWIAALPIHDVNDFVDSDERLDVGAGRRPPIYVGLFALDRFRSSARLLTQLRKKGIERIVNLPSVSFFDGRSTSILDSLDLGYEKEVAFLREAKLMGFRVALCTRRAALRAIEDVGMFDAVLCHDGPRTAFTLWRPEPPLA